MIGATIVSEPTLVDLPLVHQGKVRDVYKVDDLRLLLVATDRISAFDCILPTPLQQKGVVLTALSAFWFAKLGDLIDHHLITADFEKCPKQFANMRSFAGVRCW